MEEELNDSCPLCGNRAYEKGKACEICGAKPESVLVSGGYLYPAEGRLFKRLLYGIIVILILGIVGGSFLTYWLTNPPIG